jgi:hypothetical protein
MERPVFTDDVSKSQHSLGNNLLVIDSIWRNHIREGKTRIDENTLRELRLRTGRVLREVNKLIVKEKDDDKPV